MIGAFAAYCRDDSDTAALRQQHLAAHLAHVERVMGQIMLAGPLKDEEGSVVGSLIVVAAGTAEEARLLIEQDPYHQAGIWKDVRIERFLPVAGTLVGGRNW
jgi:uncharacterized protein